MKIINKYNLPKPVFELAKKEKENYQRKPGSYGVTTIMKPIREIILSRRYEKEIEVDVSELINVLFGTALHEMFEKFDDEENVLKEKEVEVEIFERKLVGKYDRYNLNTFVLEDYKTAKTRTIEYADFDDYKRQGLIYSWMLRKQKKLVEKIRFYMFLKDFTVSKVGYENYPVAPIYVWEHEVSSTDMIEIEEYIYNRFKLLVQNENKPDDELPLCTPKERWNTGDKFAVMNTTQQRAMKLFDNEKEAVEYSKNIKNSYVEKRSGFDLKCNRFCPVRRFCPYMVKII